MPILSTNGANLHFVTKGEGPYLLLAPGLASDSASWAPIVEHLARRRTLIMPDNRGSGQTRDSGAQFSLCDVASDYIALLDFLGARRVDVLGHSMGAAIALTIAANYPQRINRVVAAAYSPKILPRSRMVIDTLLSLREGGADDELWYRSFFVWLFAPRMFADRRAVDAAIGMAIGYPHRQSPEDMRRQVDAFRAADMVPTIAQVEAPICAISGEQDLLYPPHEIESQFSKLNNATCFFIADAAHSLHWDVPVAFSAKVMEFLDA